MSSAVISVLLFASCTVIVARPQIGLNQQLGAGVQPVPVAVDTSDQTAISGVQPEVSPIAGNGQIGTAVQPVASGPVALPGGGTSERTGDSIPAGILWGDPSGGR